jgi:hypothetical protein
MKLIKSLVSVCVRLKRERRVACANPPMDMYMKNNRMPWTTNGQTISPGYNLISEPGLYLDSSSAAPPLQMEGIVFRSVYLVTYHRPIDKHQPAGRLDKRKLCTSFILRACSSLFLKHFQIFLFLVIRQNIRVIIKRANFKSIENSNILVQIMGGKLSAKLCKVVRSADKVFSELKMFANFSLILLYLELHLISLMICWF